MVLRLFIIAPLALIAAVAAVSNAIVRSEAQEPELSARLWPGHPEVLRSTAMAGVGEAAAKGQLPSADTTLQVRSLARRSPMTPEPFLVEAALAQKRGEWQRASNLLVAARTRDPRAAAARFLLADQHIRRGDIVAGLKELTVLGRLVPGLAEQLLPGLAEYARRPGAIEQLKALFRDSPDLEPALLSTLASDAANADLVLAIAALGSLTGDEKWRAKLLESLVANGQYAKAYSVWARFAGMEAPQGGIYRPDFAPSSAPLPFNWALMQVGGGLAEPAPGGGLRVLHYGRIDSMLARQMLSLQPGRYQLSMSVSGEIRSDGQLRWRLRCLPSKAPILELPITAANARQASGQFAVSAQNCPAQMLELVGAQADMPTSLEATVSPLQLTRVGE